MAVPNFKTAVQNNRIKSTTNSIVSTLNFARQSAAINQTSVTACAPAGLESCSMSYNWSDGVALLQGNAKIAAFTPPAPPTEPPFKTPPSPTLSPVPKVMPEPIKPAEGGAEFYMKNTTTSHRWNPPERGYGKHPYGCKTNNYYITHVTVYIENKGNVVETKHETNAHCDMHRGGKEGGGSYTPKIEHINSILSLQLYQYIQDAISALEQENKQELGDYNSKMEQYKAQQKAASNVEQANQALKDAWQVEYNKAQQDHQKQLAAYQQEKKKYDEQLASTPGMTVTVDNPVKLLASNPFAITVSNNLSAGALVYKQDKLQGAGGEIYIQDKRGKGEHSRTICVNMLGNIKVVKGNQSCP